MDFINKMERKHGHKAIANLTSYLIACYVFGYIMMKVAPNVVGYLTLDPGAIFRGQIWRIISWVLIPPSSLNIFTIIMLFFYYSIGRTLEQTWGDFKYNLYIFSGILFTVIGAIIFYLLESRMHPGSQVLLVMPYLFSTFYINMSIFLAFAVTYPETKVYLYFLIPIKMKWMGFVEALFVGYEFISGPLPTKVVILASMLNFLVYYLLVSKTPKRRRRPAKSGTGRKNNITPIRRDVEKPAEKKPVHRCCVCGRTELSDPDLEFRYCSKCQGNFEYCQDHLFNHEHKKQEDN